MSVHASLTGADLHEPKGAATATINTIYVADGLGSGSWITPPASSISVADADGIFTGANTETVLTELYKGPMTVESTFLDISNPETVLLPIPYNCVVQRINITLLNAITVADSVVTVTRSDGAAMGSQTITQLGSTEGTTFQFVPSGNATMTYSSHKYVKLVSDGGSTTACRAFVQMLVQRT